jgi:translation initiation factor 1
VKVNVSEKRNPKTGNPTTVVSNIQHNPQVIDNLATKLKKSCGAGGFVKAKTITVHGSHTEKIKSILEKEGFEVTVK